MNIIENVEQGMDELLDIPEFRDDLACDSDEERLFAILYLGMEMRVRLNESSMVVALAAYALMQRLKQQRSERNEERTVVA